MRHRTWKLFGILGIALLIAAPAGAEIKIGVAAPLTGPYAWGGVEMQDGARLAVADLNVHGGVLGERVEMITADDHCDNEQAIAAAKKLVADKVVAVVGHPCSSAAVPASKAYADAGILMISTFATNPKLTEQGFRSVFRVVGRDDLQGKMAAELLAKRWGDWPIAILHDGEPYGKGLAEKTKKRLNELGIAEAMFDAITPGQVDYFDVIKRMQADRVGVLYYGGYAPEAALIIRQARSAGYDLQLVSGDAIINENFSLIAGPAADSTLFTSVLDPSFNPEAAVLTERLTRPGIEGAFTAYAALQAWAQAVEKAGTFQTKAVADALRAGEFDTVLGRIGFDNKGDVTGYDTFVWYQWQGGDYVPVDPNQLTK